MSASSFCRVTDMRRWDTPGAWPAAAREFREIWRGLPGPQFVGRFCPFVGRKFVWCFECTACVLFNSRKLPCEYLVMSSKQLDESLRCGICGDYYQIAVLISACSHTFCSLCIRRALEVKQECPACRSACGSSDLIPNRLIDEIVSAYNAKGDSTRAAKVSKPQLVDLTNRSDDSSSANDSSSDNEHSAAANTLASGHADDKAAAAARAAKPSAMASTDPVPAGRVACPVLRFASAARCDQRASRFVSQQASRRSCCDRSASPAAAAVAAPHSAVEACCQALL